MKAGNAYATDLFEHIVCKLADAASAGRLWESTFKTDFLSDGSALVMKGQKKRRRIDHCLATALGSTVAVEKKARTTYSFLCAHPDLYSASKAIRMNENFVCSTVSAAWLSFAKTQHLAFSSDGVRCGNPATDVLVCPAYDVEYANGCWLPPMDFECWEFP